MKNLLEIIPTAEIVAWRRYLHAHPELSFHEVETANYIENVLKTFPNLEISRPIENGIVATLKGGKEGKTIAFRADIDALPIQEESDVEFISQNDGVMHACGHDTHTAILLGAVKVLCTMPEKISGTIKFIFQPAEETPPGGAILMVKSGILDDVDKIYGLHIFPRIPAGAIGYSYGAMTAASDLLTLEIIGQGAHAMAPEFAIDPITIGAEIIQAINNVMARRVAPTETAVCSWGKFQSGSEHNVIPERATLLASVRTRNPELRESLKTMIEETIEGICKMHHAKYVLNYEYGYSSVMNAKEEMDEVVASAKEILGKNALFPVPPMLAGEDFSAYTDVKPGAFFVLGGGSVEDGYEFINHHPKFKIDEKSLPIGTAMFVKLALNVLK
ncbi:amidohydrolase [Pilibacter termitis]|uniref:Amidohydrolase n=1 Tax=Pilibacter termitis TaxID=263852 RepID=A0A1T4MTW0_9ENTE|nr:amidohydrolase [Pilibacter termitis]SJZ70068.1 amidohydrolase [Pilibacter termitis]